MGVKQLPPSGDSKLDAARRYRREWARRNSADARKWAVENPLLAAEAEKVARQRARIALSDTYIKQLLTKDAGVSFVVVPPALVEAKRAELKIKRFLKEQAK